MQAQKKIKNHVLKLLTGVMPKLKEIPLDSCQFIDRQNHTAIVVGHHMFLGMQDLILPKSS